jgi:hypothetical protein
VSLWRFIERADGLVEFGGGQDNVGRGLIMAGQGRAGQGRAGQVGLRVPIANKTQPVPSRVPEPMQGQHVLLTCSRRNWCAIFLIQSMRCCAAALASLVALLAHTTPVTLQSADEVQRTRNTEG